MGRLRCDAALRSTLPTPRPGQRRGRGRPRKYGKQRISLAKRAGQRRGWQTAECTVYGEVTTKTYKTFLATYAPVGGMIRVVLVKEDHGWHAFFCTDINVSAVEILEAFADRATIEQDFHDVKEVWGAGQQQVRNIWTNVAVYNLNLWMHTLVEIWAWNQKHEQLCDRSDSPWDDAERRPSHANRRKALRQRIMQNELSTLRAAWWLPRKFIDLAPTHHDVGRLTLTQFSESAVMLLLRQKRQRTDGFSFITFIEGRVLGITYSTQQRADPSRYVCRRFRST